MLLKICQQYGEGTHRVSEAVHFGEHPKRYLKRHQNGNTHKNAVKKKQLFQRMRAKGSIYTQLVTGVGNSNQSIVERSVKKFMKTVFARKRLAIRENFEDVINYLTNFCDRHTGVLTPEQQSNNIRFKGFSRSVPDLYQ